MSWKIIKSTKGYSRLKRCEVCKRLVLRELNKETTWAEKCLWFWLNLPSHVSFIVSHYLHIVNSWCDFMSTMSIFLQVKKKLCQTILNNIITFDNGSLVKFQVIWSVNSNDNVIISEIIPFMNGTHSSACYYSSETEVVYPPKMCIVNLSIKLYLIVESHYLIKS